MTKEDLTEKWAQVNGRWQKVQVSLGNDELEPKPVDEKSIYGTLEEEAKDSKASQEKKQFAPPGLIKRIDKGLEISNIHHGHERTFTSHTDTHNVGKTGLISATTSISSVNSSGKAKPASGPRTSRGKRRPPPPHMDTLLKQKNVLKHNEKPPIPARQTTVVTEGDAIATSIGSGNMSMQPSGLTRKAQLNESLFHIDAKHLPTEVPVRNQTLVSETRKQHYSAERSSSAPPELQNDKKNIVANAKITIEMALNGRIKGIPETERAKNGDHSNFVKSRWGFSARTKYEITYSLNDIFRVLDEELGRTKYQLPPQTGWLVAEHVATGKIGYVALNYVVPISEHEAMNLLKTISSVATKNANVRENISASNLSVPDTQNMNRSIAEVPSPTKQYEEQDFGSFTNIGAPIPDSLYQSSGSFYSFDNEDMFRHAERKNNGYATDVIAVRSRNGTSFYATDFNVRFTGSSSKTTYLGTQVQVKVDGKPFSTMYVRENGDCTFRDLGRQCKVKILSSALENTQKERCELTYEHRYSRKGINKISYVTASLWIFNYDDSILVSDIDGTITKSDVGGMVNTVGLGKLGFKQRAYAHAGICTFYRNIQRVTNCRILYLTARPMNLIKETRTYIEDLEQTCMYTNANVRLPPGPVVTDTTDLFSSFKKEVVNKTSHHFKTEMLITLKSCFASAGRDTSKYPIFIATFGNKQTDVMAYEAAGAPRLTMFLIDSYSSITVMHGNKGWFSSYDDQRLLQTTLEMIDLIKKGMLPMPP